MGWSSVVPASSRPRNFISVAKSLSIAMICLNLSGFSMTFFFLRLVTGKTSAPPKCRLSRPKDQANPTHRISHWPGRHRWARPNRRRIFSRVAITTNSKVSFGLWLLVATIAGLTPGWSVSEAETRPGSCKALGRQELITSWNLL